MKEYKLVVSCCICHDYKNPDTNKWYTPTLEERRKNYFNGVKLSHTYCPIDIILNMEKDGFKAEEIKDIVDNLESVIKND
jgi:hypothetical protein